MNPFAESDWDGLAFAEWRSGNWSNRAQTTISCFTERTSERLSGKESAFFSPSVSESDWLDMVSGFVDMQRGWSLLDIGAGEGLMTKRLEALTNRIVCVEPSPLRAQILRDSGYEVVEELWLNSSFKEKFDLVLSCRSFGVSALNNGRPEIIASLRKMNELARKKVVIIIPELEVFRMPCSGLFPDGLSRQPYLLHAGALLSMGFFPELRYFSRFIPAVYDSIDQCFEQDFGKYSWSSEQVREIKACLQKRVENVPEGVKRNRELLTSVVSWVPVGV